MIDPDKQIMPMEWAHYPLYPWWHQIRVKEKIPVFEPKSKRDYSEEYTIGAEVTLCYLIGICGLPKNMRKEWDNLARLHKIWNKFCDLNDDISIEDFYKIWHVIWTETRLKHGVNELKMLKYGSLGYQGFTEDEDIPFTLTGEMYFAIFYAFISVKLNCLTEIEDHELDLKLLKKVGKQFFPDLEPERYLDIQMILLTDQQTNDFIEMVFDAYGSKIVEQDEEDPFDDPETNNLKKSLK